MPQPSKLSSPRPLGIWRFRGQNSNYSSKTEFCGVIFFNLWKKINGRKKLTNSASYHYLYNFSLSILIPLNAYYSKRLKNVLVYCEHGRSLAWFRLNDNGSLAVLLQRIFHFISCKIHQLQGEYIYILYICKVYR